MEKRDNLLVLKDKDDETMLFDLCDSYLTWLNEDDDNDEFYLDYQRMRDNVEKEIGYFNLHDIVRILEAFSHRDALFVSLWDKILKCLELADLVKVEFKREED